MGAAQRALTLGHHRFLRLIHRLGGGVEHGRSDRAASQLAGHLLRVRLVGSRVDGSLVLLRIRVAVTTRDHRER